MADHGEAWGEHKVYFHGQDLFDEQLRVPLIIAIPGQTPRVDRRPVALVDVGPTLLDLVGAPIPPAMRGQAACCRASDGEAARRARPIFAELLPATAWPHHAAMMVDGKHKLIHRISDRRWELYDLAADPGEKTQPGRRARRRARRSRRCARKLVAFEERRR